MFCLINTLRNNTNEGNHLSAAETALTRRSIPYVGRPYQKFGLLARGVYPFQLACFQTRSSLWHFQMHHTIGYPLGPYIAVTVTGTLAYWAKHEHYRHRSLCGHGLSSANKS